MARPEQHQETFWNPSTHHSFWQVEEEEEPYPYQYPTYPSQYTPYNADFISPSVTPAPYTVGSRTGSTCSTPPPVPVATYTGNINHWNHGDRSIPQGHYSSPRGAGHEEMIDARPLPATPVPITPPDPDAARLGQVRTSTQKNRATVMDVEKIAIAAAPTTGGAFVTVFGKRYNKRPVIIIAVVIILVVIIVIGLGAGLGSKSRENKDVQEPKDSLHKDQEGDSDGGLGGTEVPKTTTMTGTPDDKAKDNGANKPKEEQRRVSEPGEAHSPFTSDPENNEDQGDND